MSRLRRALLGAALAGVLVTPSPGAAGPCAGRLIEDGDGWTTVLAPAFPSGGARVTAYVAAPGDPDTLWVTNGTVVMVSRDSGCVFRAVWTAPPLGTVTALSAAGGLVHASVGTPGGPRVLVWTGDAFDDMSGGLPPAGVPDPVVGNDGVRWLLVHAGEAALLYRGVPGTATWTAVVPAPAASAETVSTRLLRRVYADPVDAATLWGVMRLPDGWPLGENYRGGGAEGLYRSGDGGTSWTQVGEVTTAIQDVEVFRAPGRAPGSVYAYLELVRAVWASHDGGRTWSDNATPGTAPVVSATQGASAGDLVVSLPGAVGRVFRFDPVASVWRPVRHGGPPIDDLSAVPHGRLTTFFGRTAEGVVRRALPTVWGSSPPALPPDVSRCWDGTFAYGTTPPPGHGPRPPSLKQVRDAGPVPAVVPAARRVVLPVGGERRVPLAVTPSRTPVDLFFLLDDTGSMGIELCAVARSVQATVARLATAGLDARFGLAEFGDYPPSAMPSQSSGTTVPPGEGSSEDTHPYELRRKIGLADDELAEALGGLRAGWGGTRPEAALTALYQSVTGAGQDSPPTGPSRADIPAGHDAGFRPEAQKFVLLVTDAPMHNGPSGKGEEDFPGPRYADVVAVLRRAGVRVLGLSTASDQEPLTDLHAVATATGAVTPIPLDCNGDTLVDLPAGRPAVCEIDGETTAYFDMATAITSLVRAIPDPASLHVSARTGKAVRARVSDDTRAIDRKRIQRVPFTLGVECLREGSERVRLTQHLAGQAMAGSVVDVVCTRDTRPPPPEDPVPDGDEPPVVALPPVPVSQPRVEPVSQVNPQPQSQAQSQSQADPNGASAVQEEEQPDVAGSAAEERLRDEELALTGLERAPRPMPADGFVAAAALVTAVACALGRRLSPQPSATAVACAVGRRLSPRPSAARRGSRAARR